MALFTYVDFGTDNGKQCSCGGTIYGYKLVGLFDGNVRVDAQCYSCHDVGVFYPNKKPFNAAECSLMHRES